MSEGQMSDEHLRQQFQDNLPSVDSDHAWARLQARLADQVPSGPARPLRRRRRTMVMAVAVGASVIVLVLVAAAALGLFGGGTQVASVDVTTGGTAGLPAASTTSASHPATTTAASPATTGAQHVYADTTTSTTLLFPSETLFKRELSGNGYQTALVYVDRREGAMFTVVWIAADPNKVTPATYDAIFDQAVTLAEKYGAADTTEGRLKVELFDSTQGGMIRDLIFESRNFNLEETTTSTAPKATSDTVPTPQ